MASEVSPARSKNRRSKTPRGLAGSDIAGRLRQIELATVSSLRALQMDIDGDDGVPASVVLRKARAALR